MHKSRRTIWATNTLPVCFLFSMLFSSCVSFDNTSKVAPPQSYQEGTSLQKSVSLSGKTWQYQIVASIFSLKDFDSTEDTHRKARQKLTLPTEWKIDYGVITDEAEVKVGELSPGVFLPNPSFYDSLPKVGMILPNPDTQTKVLSKGWITVGTKKTLRLSETGIVYGGLTKPEQIILDHYYVNLGKLSYGFVIYNHLLLRFEDSLIERLIDSIELSELDN